MSENTSQALTSRAKAAFKDRFHRPAAAVAFAPGRVNLLGEHTDYNGGFVLPMPLRLGIAVAIGPGAEPGVARMASDHYDEVETRPFDAPASGAWSDYVLGSIEAGASPALAAQGLDVLVVGNLPVGAGLSSSAAVEVATLRAVQALSVTPSDPVKTALTARAVENDFVGMPCGIMDQFAVSVGRPGAALFLNTRTLESHTAPLPEGFSFLVISSGVSHKLTEDGYATRVAECAAAAEALGVESLSDLTTRDLGRITAIAPPLDRRARHIVTENQRVLEGYEALKRGDVERFGALMVASHASQRDDYAVSLPEIDALVGGALAAGAIGARLTGGGFGGSIVALVANGRVPELRRLLGEGFPTAEVLAMM